VNEPLVSFFVRATRCSELSRLMRPQGDRLSRAGEYVGENLALGTARWSSGDSLVSQAAPTEAAEPLELVS
jgi:hypothetical protein